ncbi:MAG TPA: hypothetical protein VK465_03120, partial [Fibrobacteria bacterium]|nr:hypothetical protein [Fibrobacteria bacterium]
MKCPATYTRSTSLLTGILLATGLLAGCASAPKTRAGDPSLPEIDVLQLKENSDEALKVAQETRLEVQSLSAKIKELEGRISSLGDEVASLPISKVEELTAQLGLVSEQLRSLEDRISKVPPPPPGRKELSIFSPTALDSGRPKEMELPPAAAAKTPEGK